jgi:Protein of unknown function (DUF3501)
MKPISSEEIVPFEQWERLRERLRPLFIHEKDRRRLAVGSHVTLLFENGQTVWYQIEEMVRAEKMSDAGAIGHEIETYNELIPAPGELSATMLIEFGESAERDAALKALLGLERHVWFRAGEQRLQAKFDTRQMSAESLSAVQFVRFALPAAGQRKFLELAQDGQLAVEIDHPKLAVQAPITGSLAAALAEDLATGKSGE